jgi:hypothetical protein
MPEKNLLANNPALKGDAAAPRSPLVRFLVFTLAGLLLLSCIAGGYFVYLMRPKVKEDPQFAKIVAENILQFTPATGFEPKGTIEWNIPSALSLRGVYYEHRTGDGVLMLLEVQPSVFQDSDDVKKHIEHVLLEKNGVSESLVVSPVVEPLTVDIQGRSRDFTISKARDPVTSTDYRLLEGTVTGRNNGTVLIGMRIAESAWNIDAVKDMLKSIR